MIKNHLLRVLALCCTLMGIEVKTCAQSAQFVVNPKHSGGACPAGATNKFYINRNTSDQFNHRKAGKIYIENSVIATLSCKGKIESYVIDPDVPINTISNSQGGDRWEFNSEYITVAPGAKIEYTVTAKIDRKGGQFVNDFVFKLIVHDGSLSSMPDVVCWSTPDPCENWQLDTSDWLTDEANEFDEDEWSHGIHAQNGKVNDATLMIKLAEGETAVKASVSGCGAEIMTKTSGDSTDIFQVSEKGKITLTSPGFWPNTGLDPKPYSFTVDVNFANTETKRQQEVKFTLKTTCTPGDLLDETIFVTATAFDNHYFDIDSLTQEVMIGKCLQSFVLESQKQFESGNVLTSVNYFALQNEENSNKLRVKNTKEGALPNGTYELLITAAAPTPVTLRVLVNHKDPCQASFDSISETAPTIDLLNESSFSWDAPYETTLVVDITNNISTICKCKLTSQTAAVQLPSTKTWPIDEIKFNSDGSSVKVFFAALSLDDVANSYISGGAEFEFSVTYSYAGKEKTHNYKITKPDPCQAKYLKVTTDCKAPTTAIKVQYNLAKEFDFINKACTFTYFPNACYENDRPIKVKLDVINPGIFYEKEPTAALETALVDQQQYNKSNQLLIKYDVDMPETEPLKTVTFSLEFGFGGLALSKITFQFTVEACSCNSWQLNDFKNQELIYPSEKYLKFKIPQCTARNQCQKSPANWKILFNTVKETGQLVNPQIPGGPATLDTNFFFKSAESEQILKLKQNHIATKTEVYKVTVVYESMDTVVSDIVSEDLQVTFKPCYCATYAIPSIADVVHKFSDQELEVPVEQAVCTGDSTNCLTVSDFKYQAKQDDGSALPSGDIIFDADRMVFIINPSANPITQKSINIKIQATTEQISLASPIELAFKVTLEPLIDTTISVEPSLDEAFEVSFKDQYAQQFTFKSANEDEGDALVITANKHPFIQTRLGANNDLFISIDGPYALNYTLAQENKTESMKIKVNDQTFKFKVKLTLTNETQSNKTESSSTESGYNSMTTFEEALTKQVQEQQRNVTKPKEIEKLKISKINLATNGILTISFNKPILEPPIRTQRKLESTVLYDIDEVLEVSIKDMDDDEKAAQQKAICGIIFKGLVDDRKLQVTLEFCEPKAITTDIVEPDLLDIKILKPSILIDAESSQPLDEIQTDQTIDVCPQLPQIEFEELQETAKAAVKISVALTIWQLLMFFSLKKALTSMFSLINALQFVVTMLVWQITLQAQLRVVLEQLRRIVLGEFIDDLELASYVKEALGLDIDEDGQSLDQKLGKERLGPANILDSFGATMVLCTLILLVLVIIILITIVICRKFGQKLKRSLFWNPMIRYTMLSSIKTNLAAMVVFSRGFPEETSQGVIAILQLFFFALVLPCIFAILLKKNAEKLGEESTIAAYGALYKGLVPENSLWTYPLVFFLRRTLFALATVYLFDRPGLQIIVQQILTLGAILYYVFFDIFEDKRQKWVEIATEGALLVFTYSSQQYLNRPFEEEEEVRSKLSILMYTALAFLLIINVALLVRTVCQSRQMQRRAKWLIEVKESYMKYRSDHDELAEEKQQMAERMRLAQQHMDNLAQKSVHLTSQSNVSSPSQQNSPKNVVKKKTKKAKKQLKKIKIQKQKKDLDFHIYDPSDNYYQKNLKEWNLEEEEKQASSEPISRNETVEEIKVEDMNVDQIVYTFHQIIYEEPQRPNNTSKQVLNNIPLKTRQGALPNTVNPATLLQFEDISRL